MADLSYSIDVQTRDAVGAINGLKTALAGLGAAFTVKELIQFSDGITNLRNKLASIQPDLNIVEKQFQALASIAIQARSPLEATADLFFRIQRSAKALGISQREAAQITESVAKALTASGQSAAEASGPLLQLGQALQSGTFQGDELRSILEGLPQVAQALADQLGVPVGALKKLGSEGQISADVFVQAMRRAKDSIDEAFGRTQTTIAQALENLKTTSKLAFDEFEKNTKTGQSLGRMIEYITVVVYNSIKSIDEFIQKWGGVIIAVGQVVLAFTAFRLVSGILGFVVGGIRTLARSVGDIIDLFRKGFAPITQAAERMVRLGKETSVTGTIFSSVILIIGRFVSMIGALTAGIATFLGLGDVIDKFKQLGDSSSEASKSIEDFKDKQKDTVNQLDDTATASENAAQKAKELANALAKIRLESDIQVQNLARGLQTTRDRLALETALLDKSEAGMRISEDQAEILRTIRGIEEERQGAVQQIQDQISKLNLEYSQLQIKDSQRGKELSGQIGILQNQIKSTNTLYESHKTGMEDLIRRNQTVKILEEDRKRTSETIIKLIEEQTTRTSKLGDILRGVNDKVVETLNKVNPAELIGKSALEKEIINIENSTKQAAQAAARQLAQAYEGLGDEITPQQAEEYARGLDQIVKQFSRLKEVQIQQAKVNATLQKSFDTGWTEAFAKYAETAKNAAEQAQSYFSIFTKGVEDAIVRFVQTGKLSFKDLANNIIAEFVRIQVRSQMLNVMGGGGLLSRLFGGFGGIGFGTGLGFGNLDYGGFFAKGGTLGAGKWGIAGEAGPEIISGPATITPMTQMPSTTTINYNINAVDAQSFRAMVARDPEFIYQVTEAGRRSQPQRRLS